MPKPTRRSLAAISVCLLALLGPLSAAPSPHDPDARIAALTRRLAEDPRAAEVYVARGVLFRERGDLALALRDFEWALALDSRLVGARIAHAETLCRFGRPEQALRELDRFLLDRPEHGRAQCARAEALAALGRSPEAAAAYERALRSLERPRPGHFVAAARAWAASGPGAVERALAMLDRGVRMLGPLASLHDAAADLALGAGRLEEAGRHAAAVRAAIASARAPHSNQRRRGHGPPAPAPALPSATVLVAAGSVWRYLDDGSDQGTAWRAPGFDDSSWASGAAQLGYGDGDESTVVGYGPNASSKHVTTWFRHAFQVADPGVFQKARLRLLRDDGAIVYLNGSEIARSNMPSGSIGFRTLAASTVGGSGEDLFHSLIVDHRQLRAGTNVLAVEIHQRSVTSSDISFDLELLGSDRLVDVVRGPYLQLRTTAGAVVRWRTDVATETVAWVGPGPAALTVGYRDPTPRTEHEAALSGLTPDTRYHYACGDLGGALAGGDADHFFVTAPPSGSSLPTRVWAIGDSGTADRDAAAVRDAYLGLAGGRHTDVWLMLGDNAYDSGTDEEYQAAVFDTYPSILRNVFLWPTLGNHDGVSASSGSQSGVYYDAFTLPTQGEAGGLPSGTEAYYSFDHGDVHFVCLDSHDTDRSAGGAMARWLQLDLAATGARWIVAYWHHPPYTKGSHDSDDPWDSGGRMFDMRQNLLPILESGGVDLVMCGHSHSYERSFLLDGHYGTSPTLAPSMVLDRGDGRADGDGTYAKPSSGPAAHEGAVYTVAGSSGKTSGGPLDHPSMFVSFNTLGSMVLDFDGGRMDARFVDASGAVLDQFTMEKGIHRTLTRDEPSISLSRGGTQNLFLDAGPGHAGGLYLIAGSFGTEPGFRLGSVRVPLNRDGWFDITLLAANSVVLQQTLGALDASGSARAAIRLPVLSDPNLIGLVLNHAFVVHDGTDFRMASNAVRLRLTP